MLQQLAGQRGHRGLAIGAGDGQQLGLVAMRLGHALQGRGEQIQLATDGQANRTRGVRHGRDHVRRKAGGTVHGVQALTIHQGTGQRTAHKPRLRQLAVQQRQLGRGFAGVGHGDFGPGTHAPARHGQARSTQAQDQHAPALQVLRLVLRPLRRHRGQRHRRGGIHAHGHGGDVGIGRIRHAGIGENLRHKGSRVLGGAQAADVGNGFRPGGQRLFFRSSWRLRFGHFRHVCIAIQGCMRADCS